MQITHLKASNWRNFKSLEFDMPARLFVVGPNASGKSNLIDVFRFLGDISGTGGGLASAMTKRGGLSKVRSLFARNNAKGRLVIEVHLRDDEDTWLYRLSVRGESGGKNRPIVDEERVEKNGMEILSRPDARDLADPELLTQTHLEQISANHEFRSLADYFAKVVYFHLVPQIIRSRSGNDFPREFGGSLIAEMNSVQPRTRTAWMRRMSEALGAAVPQFESLDIDVDAAGTPHLRAGYRNWRNHASNQSEAEFSDGTLRLIGLLWTMVSARDGMLLLEEPELSLNTAVVRQLPAMLSMTRRSKDVQFVLSTHAPEILDDEGVDADEILVLTVGKEGTTAATLSSIESIQGDLAAELPKSEIVQPFISPLDLDALVTIGRGK